MRPIPVSTPDLSELERTYLLESFDSGWISSEGPFVTRFEKAMADRAGRRAGIAVSNGTVALEIAIRAVGIGPGDEVILPTFTIISCAAAVIRCGATPVVVDADPETWNMNLDQVAARITPRTRAVLAVHTYGLPMDLTALSALCTQHQILLIEDGAEAHGGRVHGRPCGSFGAASVFSFYANKLISTGEGGMILVDSALLEERSRSLRNLCFGSEHRFIHRELGWNGRMTSLQAAVGLAQAERADEMLAMKRLRARWYRERLSDVTGIRLAPSQVAHGDNTYWVFGIVIDDSISLDARALGAALAEAHIGTRPFFWALHEQPALRALGLFEGESHPVAERLGRRGLYLPMSTTLPEVDIEYICTTVRELIQRHQ